MTTAVHKTLVPTHWPYLHFTEAGLVRLDEVRAFCETLTDHPQVRDELVERLDYLHTFGGTVSDTDPRPRFRVTLGLDFAPLSFTLTWQKLDLSTGEYVYAFNGGLIWHGGSNDPLCVSLTPTLWGIHT